MSQYDTTWKLVNSLEECDDISSWINSTLGPHDTDKTTGSDLAELDQQLTTLVAALDIAYEDTASQLERIIDDVSRSVPRLSYDLHFMKDSATTLQTVLTQVQDNAKNSVPLATNEALDRLRVLDRIKGHMEAAREVLREAESWSTLEEEVTSLLKEQNYEKAAERLSEASKSMVVFQNTPEFDLRRTLMVSLQNQLEASLSSALVAAITSQDVVACRNYYFIFSNIQRESEFRNYYYGSRRAVLVTVWQDHFSTETSNSSLTLAEFFQRFYANFLSLLNTERISIPSIFPDPQASLSSLIVSVLTALQPTISQQLSALFDKLGASALQELISAYKTTEDFATNTSKIMEKIKFSVSITSPTEPGETSESMLSRNHKHRRRSSRSSISWKTGIQRPHLNALGTTSVMEDNLEWDRELFQPFLDFQVDYESLEHHLLQDTYDGLVQGESWQRVPNLDRARVLRERIVDISGIAEESIQRCNTFTHGYGAVGLLHTLDKFLKSFIDSWTSEISVKTAPSSRSLVTISAEDLSDLDYTLQDWSQFQQTLHLLASARTISDRLSGFETKLRSNLSGVANLFRLAEQDPTNFTISPSRGQDQLFQQSVLNSAELQSLLDVLNSEVPHAKDGAGRPLLTEARAAISNFARTCQASMHDTILSPLHTYLEVYATSPLWTASGDPKSRTIAAGGSDLQVPIFSLSPSDTVQKVCEGLLNLPRLFEVYAEDDALSFSLHTLPHVDSDLLKGIGERYEPAADVPSQRAMRRASLVPMKPIPLDPETVSSAWLSSLGHSLLSHLMTDILPDIPDLTPAGAAQLSSDLSYLSNIMGALNVESDELRKWKEYVEMSDEDGRKELANSSKDDGILRVVARVKGWRN